MKTLFSDSDGVIFDFEGGFTKFFGFGFHDHSPNVTWDLIASNPSFYETLPLLPHATEYWELIAPYQPIILTGCPSTGFHAAAAAKKRAYRRLFGNVEVITCMSKNKPAFIRNPADVLIDDTSVNVERWRNAGANGVHFTDMAQFKLDWEIVKHTLR